MNRYISIYINNYNKLKCHYSCILLSTSFYLVYKNIGQQKQQTGNSSSSTTTSTVNPPLTTCSIITTTANVTSSNSSTITSTPNTTTTVVTNTSVTGSNTNIISLSCQFASPNNNKQSPSSNLAHCIHEKLPSSSSSSSSTTTTMTTTSHQHYNSEQDIMNASYLTFAPNQEIKLSGSIVTSTTSTVPPP